jgi:hypothetical protein
VQALPVEAGWTTRRHIDANEGAVYTLIYHGRAINPLIYAEPGDSIHVKLTVFHDEPPKVEFSGSWSKVNNFMAAYLAEIRRRGIAEGAEPVPERFKSFMALNIKRHWGWVKFYDKYFSGVQVPELFKHAVCTDIKCRRTTEVIEYLLSRYYYPFNAGQLPYIPFDSSFTDFEKDMPPCDSLAVQYSCYRSMLERYATLLGHRRRAGDERGGAAGPDSAWKYTWDALCAIKDPLLHDAAMYSTIVTRLRMPAEQMRENAKKMLEAFRTEAKYYEYYAAAREESEGK